jgi:hypothetical protein
VLDVQPCNAGSDCIACNEAGKQGLKVQDKTTVHCKGAAGKFCAHGGAQIRWDFKGGGIQPKSEYRATVRYSSTTTKLTAGKTAYQKAYCRDASGDPAFCEGSGLGKNLAVFSGLPELAGSAGALETTYWPHRLDLYEVTESGETLIACADPEIIVDPPGGGGSGVPPTTTPNP